MTEFSFWDYSFRIALHLGVLKGTFLLLLVFPYFYFHSQLRKLVDLNKINIWLLLLADIKFQQITSWLRSSDPVHMASVASSCRRAHTNNHTHTHTYCAIQNAINQNSDNRPDLTQYLIPIHSFTRSHTPDEKLADCPRAIVPFIFRWEVMDFRLKTAYWFRRAICSPRQN